MFEKYLVTNVVRLRCEVGSKYIINYRRHCLLENGLTELHIFLTVKGQVIIRARWNWAKWYCRPTNPSRILRARDPIELVDGFHSNDIYPVPVNYKDLCQNTVLDKLSKYTS